MVSSANEIRTPMSRALVPVVDLAGTDRGIAAELDDAYREVGFCSIVNHGVPQDLVDDAFAASRSFHALDAVDKERIAIGPSHRGYIGLATSTIVTSSIEKGAAPNQSESLIFGRPMEADDPDILAGLPLSGVNQWPESLPEIRSPVLAYQAAMEDLCVSIRGHVARALGASSDVFEAAFSPPTTYLRLLRYPMRRPEAPEWEYGSSPHTDYGFVTILAVDDVPGLEVLGPDGRWILAVPPPGGLVMNAGDLLHRWSNGLWRSTPHRVYNDPDQVRYSIPFFYEPHVTADVEPLPHLGEPRFEPVNYGEYAMHRFRSNYSQHRSS